MTCVVDWNALGVWLTALATAALAITAAWQLGHLRRQLKTESERERRWRTIDACERWSMSEVLRDAKVAVFGARSSGRLVENPLAHARNIRSILNYLDAVAIGVRQDAYIKEIVIAHLSTVVVDIVHNGIEGGWADFQIRAEDYADLIWLRDEIIMARPELSGRTMPSTPSAPTTGS